MSTPDSEATEFHPPVQPEAEVGGDQKEEEEEGEGEGECGFCLYMKAGGCRDAFIAWEKCIEEAEKNKEDLVDKCANITAALKQCMDSHYDYYEPILRAEKAAEKQAIEELDKEKEAQEQQAEVIVPNDGDGASSGSKDEK